MIEVPSLLYELDALLPRVDFVSVGSNDLLQYLFAADRNNTRVAGRYDPLSAAPAARARRHRRGGQAPRPAAQPVRRDGRPAARGDGADRPRLPLDLDGAGLDRPGQVHGAEPGRRGPAALDGGHRPHPAKAACAPS